MILTAIVLLVGFYMAWSIGANDVANAMGTSVGSKALTLKKAVIIAAVLEFSGAFFLGSRVSETMQQGLVDPQMFVNDPYTFMYGMLAALLATAIWLQVASYFGWPVSTTHAIVGAVLGFGLIIGGAATIHWNIVGAVVASWVISPVLSGIISFIIFSILQRLILYSFHPIRMSRRLIPVLVFFVFATFTLSLTFHGLNNIGFNPSVVEALLLSLGVGLLAAFVSILLFRSIKKTKREEQKEQEAQFGRVISMQKALKHLQRVRISSEGSTKEEVAKLLDQTANLTKELRKESGLYTPSSRYQNVENMFAYLQILSAGFVAFAHGANDVANAIGPVDAVLEVARTGAINLQKTTPAWLLALGGAGIVVGLATWGWRVIETVGNKITHLTPTRGFSAEFGAALTILLASKLGLPVSTTHCIVGSVLGVGLARGLSSLNLRTLRDIGLSWLITIPASAIVCVVFYYIISGIASIL
ncbi:MAG: inorganic phosphate transporter [Chlamydiia bacterium]|nr:inorganic phosphate transporter [Chlamydiia bacterium]MCP5509617.1 inorganic phosphate transporter [Chlamydiales bacterium]HPE85219.1 inorganic phosphate transporter [Chlamydiales bacterium]